MLSRFELAVADPIVTRFDPALGVILPDGSAVHRSDLGPCRQCGAWRFRIWRYHKGDGSAELRVSCPDCSPAAGPRTARDDGRVLRTKETPFGWMDARSGVVEVDRG